MPVDSAAGVTSPRRADSSFILLMLGAAVTFGQDGLSRLLAETYSVLSIVAIRYWFFFFVIGFCMTRPGGIRVVARTKHPGCRHCVAFF